MKTVRVALVAVVALLQGCVLLPFAKGGGAAKGISKVVRVGCPVGLIPGPGGKCICPKRFCK